MTDEELIRRARQAPSDEATRCLDALYRRFYRKVGYWCLRITGNEDDAADLAQEVFLRVHDRLDTFRLESRFSTWLYTVTRSVAINRGIAARRRQTYSLDREDSPEPVEAGPDAARLAETSEIVEKLERSIREDLDPLEAKVLLLHHVYGFTLPAITEQLGLQNRSGAKAYIVGAKRKLKRRFGRRLTPSGGGGSNE